MNNPSKGFIAVHLGAGQHSETLKDKYLKLSKEACEKGIESLQQNGNVLEAVTSAVIALEDSPMTNAGYGSNLTYNGYVECDASIMDGSNLQYGAVGAVADVKNPIELAKRLCQYQTVDIGHGRIPPSFLVGSGASAWAREMGVPTVPPENLISGKYGFLYRGSIRPQAIYFSVKAQKIYKHYKRKVDSDSGEITQLLKKRMDTVGAVCVDEFGNIASACSSGGIILKYPGRIGQAGIWGCGTWASKGEISVGTSTSGCGEHLIRTSLARTVADSILATECPTTSLHNAMQSKFIDSRLLQHLNEKLGGVIAIRYSPEEGCGDLLWSHTTNTMIIGYKSSTDKSSKSRMSNLPVPEVGKKATVEGVIFKL